MRRHHALPFGAEIESGHVRFRLWAPGASRVDLAIENRLRLPMADTGDGWFEIGTDVARAGTRYRYGIGSALYPDPASRFQPDGPTGPSVVVDPNAYEWGDEGWRGRPWSETVLYELHPGTFSEKGDFDGVAGHLDHLVALGVNAIEIMPVAECPGRWNWGYDGVLPFAVEAQYGGPGALKRLVERCHAAGLSVILDVVYNHFGPEGNFLHAYAARFFTGRHATPWGAGLNFDGEGSADVRRFFIENALYWLEEFHIDGLRFDAVHAILDDSTPHFVAELGARIRERQFGRPIHLILENDGNQARLLGAGQGGPGAFDAQWNDDFHHVLRVLIGGAEGGYYRDYTEQPAERLLRVLTEGFDYQGATSPHRAGALRGEPSGFLSPASFVAFLQNHDQVGNHAYGWRLSHFAPSEAIRAATAILLLSPQIPMLFMGQEWDAAEPFPFFCDFGPELAEAVRQGRLAEFGSFPEFQSPAARKKIPDPCAEATYLSAKLDWSARVRPGHRDWLDFHRRLIELRRRVVAPLLDVAGSVAATGTVLGPAALAVSWRMHGGAELRLLANLGARPQPREPEPEAGQRIFATHEALAAGELPPWFVAFDLVEAEPPP